MNQKSLMKQAAERDQKIINMDIRLKRTQKATTRTELKTYIDKKIIIYLYF